MDGVCTRVCVCVCVCVRVCACVRVCGGGRGCVSVCEYLEHCVGIHPPIACGFFEVCLWKKDTGALAVQALGFHSNKPGSIA